MEHSHGRDAAGAPQAEWDPLLLLLTLQLGRAQEARGVDEPDWIQVDALSHVLEVVVSRGRVAIDDGWAELAEQRGLLERRKRGERTELKLSPDARRMFRF